MIAKANITGWKWRFTQDESFVLDFGYFGTLKILSDSGNVMVDLKGDTLTIHRHYHFDGATYAPDFEGVLKSSAVHDALLQLHEKYPHIIARSKADEAFKNQMRADGFKLWPLYFTGVKLWSWIKE